MDLLENLLLIGLVSCAIAVNITKKLLPSVLIYSTFSVMLSVIWLMLEAPDLAITEAAVGTGIETVLYFLALKGINQVRLKGSGEDK